MSFWTWHDPIEPMLTSNFHCVKRNRAEWKYLTMRILVLLALGQSKIFLKSNIAREIKRSLVSPCMQHSQTPSLQILQCLILFPEFPPRSIQTKIPNNTSVSHQPQLVNHNSTKNENDH